MKKIFSFAKRKRGASPSASETGSLTSAAGYELRDRDLSKLHRAACAGDLAKLRQLCKKQDPNQQDKERRTPLHLACVNGHPELVSYLVENNSKLNLCDSDSRSPLMKAIQCQQERCATILLEHDADTNLVDINGNTALHLSALIPTVSVATQLLEHGANVDAQNKAGCTPLMLAVAENHQEMVEFLLQKGADINAKDKTQRTSLMIAAGNGQISLVKLLVQKDADISVKDDKAWTADDYAVMNGHHACSHLIIEHGSKQRLKTSPPYHGASKVQGLSMFSSPDRLIDGAFPLGGPATDREVADDPSQAESESRNSHHAASIASWTSSDEEEELEFSPKKSQKPSLAVLMNASIQSKKTVPDTTSIIKMQPIANAQDSESVSEEELGHDSNKEELHNRTLPEALSYAQSLPHPAFVSPGSLPQPTFVSPGSIPQSPQMASAPSPGFNQEESGEEEFRGGSECSAKPYPESSRSPEPPAHDRSKNVTTAIGRKVLMSELGLEDEDAESAWDSESASESPRKQASSPLPSLAANTQMQRILEEKSEDCSVKLDLQKPETQHANTEKQDVSKPAIIESVKKHKSDLMEEFGLDDADDIEDVSDWDSISTSPRHAKAFQVSKNDDNSQPELPLVPTKNKENALLKAVGIECPTNRVTSAGKADAPKDPSQSVNEQRPKSYAFFPEKHCVAPEQNTHLQLTPESQAEPPLDASSSENVQVGEENENKLQEAKHVLEMLKYTENASSGNPVQKDISHMVLKSKLEATEQNKLLEEEITSSESDSSWEERYERMWVDQEKKEVKSHFKTVAAELKQKFGDMIENPKTSPSSKSPREICHKKSTMISESQSSVTRSASREDHCNMNDFAGAELQPITQQSDSATQDILANKFCSGDQTELDLLTFQPSSNTKIPATGGLLNSLEIINLLKNQVKGSNTGTQKESNNPQLHKSLVVYGRIADQGFDSEENVGHSQQLSFKEDYLHKSVNHPEFMGLVSPTWGAPLSIITKNKEEIQKPEDVKTFKNQDAGNAIMGKLRHGPGFENAPSQGSSDEEVNTFMEKGLERDVQRFKNEVGMLQAVFLNLEKDKAELQKEVEGEKFKSTQSLKSDEIEKIHLRHDSDNRVAQNMTPYNTKQQSLAPRELSGNGDETIQPTSSLSVKEKSKTAQYLFKGKNVTSDAENMKNAKKNQAKKSSKQTTAKSLNQQKVLSVNGNPLQAFDDSTLSETSQDEGRSDPKTGNKKDKATREVDDDFEDLTLSSDTATEDCDSPTNAYRNAMFLLEQLSVEGQDSVSLLKIQNIVHEYERLIEKENGRYGLLLGKVRKLESERKALQKIIEETRELKSSLEHQKVEWESDLNSVRFTLKQEEEKRKSAEMLYDKSRDQLRKKEDQCCKEMEERQQLELSLRNSELELRTLRNSLKQVEEERSESQRLLSQERSARVLQEGFLNSHLLRQKEEEEKKIIAKKEECLTQISDREKELTQRNHSIQEEIIVLKLELDQVRARNQEEEGKTIEENEALKEKLEDLRRDLKLNEEALTQTVYQYNRQFNALKAESTMLLSKIEHEQQSKERLETELESIRSRLASAVQELEVRQASKSDAERTFQRERDDWLRSQDKLNYDLANVREANNNLSQQLTKAESKVNSLENELHRTTLSLREKTLVLESSQRDLNQTQCRAKELEHTLHMEKEQISKSTVKQETMQERLAQIQSENMLLRQQLEDLQNKGILKEKAVNETQDRFSDIFSKLRDDADKKVSIVEDRNKELITKTNDLREQMYKIETEKVEREAELRKVQQELVDALKKMSMSEASLVVTTKKRNELEEEKLRLQNEIEKFKCKMQESEERCIQAEHSVHELKTMLGDKEREVLAASQKLHEFSTVSSGTEKTVKQLEEHVQMLEIENARLEAAMKQQTGRIEMLQREQQESVSARAHLEDLITNLQSTKIGLEEQLNQQVHQQTVLSQTAKESHNLWEDELRSRSRLGVRLAQLDKEKTELTDQVENERRKVKKVLDLKRSLETRLDQEMKRNTELLKEANGMKKLLKGAKKKLKEFESGELGSHEAENQVSRLKLKIDELSQSLDAESSKCTQLEATNRDLREQLSSVKMLHKNHERLEKSKRQLEDEVANLKRHVETNMTDHDQMGQYKREIEERARQEIRQKLEEVNMFLQTQAASHETLEQMRATNDASLRNQMEHRIRDLESELCRIKGIQQDSISQKESTQTELERYRDLYSEEIKVRKSLAAKLDRANERLAEANAKLISERQRTKTLIANSFVNGNLSASPFMDTSQLGSSLALNRSLGLAGNFLSPVGNGISSNNRVEAYLAKMQLELEKNITKELDQANVELESGSVRMSPVGSTAGTLRNLSADQDPVSRATQQYLEVLQKNSKI